MSIGKIGLIGTSEFIRETLFNLFKENNFEADLLELQLDNLNSIDISAYDLIITSSDFASAGGEEPFFELLLSARSFLLVENTRKLTPQNISPDMSLEDILMKVGNTMFTTPRTNDKPARSSHRVRVNIDVEYESEDKIHKCSITTLSNNGAFISTLNPLPKGAQIRLLFKIPCAARPIYAKGTVLYSIGYNLDSGIISAGGQRKTISRPGMAIFFDSMDEMDKESVKTFVEQKAFHSA